MKLKCIINLNRADERKGRSPSLEGTVVWGVFAELGFYPPNCVTLPAGYMWHMCGSVGKTRSFLPKGESGPLRGAKAFEWVLIHSPLAPE